MIAIIDPGARAGACYIHCECGAYTIAETAVYPCPDFKAAQRILQDHCAKILVIEGHYFGPRSSKIPPTSVAKLVEREVVWRCAADSIGARVTVVQPSTWIPAMTAGMTGGTTKDRIRRAVELRLPGSRYREHEIDAVALGLWYVEENAARGRLPAADTF